MQQLQQKKLQVAIADIGDSPLEVIVKSCIDSTNSWSLQQCKSGRSLPFVCFAEQQMQGRGRRGKSWVMMAGSNIAMSIAWPVSVPSDGAGYEQLNLLPISVAMAIVETLESLGLRKVQIKWPNDVYVQGKKIAGILLETQALNLEARVESEQGCQIAVVIGIGLNFDMSAYGQDDPRAVFSFTDICSQAAVQSLDVEPERTAVAAKLLQNLVQMCQNYPQQALSNLNKFEQQYDYCKDKCVDIVLDDGSILSGVAQGVNSRAELLVLIDGRQQRFNSAEVSVRAAAKVFSGKGKTVS
jgi:BirA family biotin operon repressor/biotin-[acetyl-CoA-carboxylase] ligase